MKKIIIFSLTFLLGSLFWLGAVKAVETSINPELDPGHQEGGESWFIQTPESWAKKVFGEEKEEIFKERYTFSIANDVVNTLNCWIRGINGCAPTLSKTTSGIKDNGALGALASLIGTMYKNQPVSAVEYFADIGQGLEIVKPVYAQGIGFSALRPVLSLWKMFRNIAYLVFVIIFSIIGFMIMFRKKIDPRTVVSIQDALPRIVVSLLLITFSYAIAGLFIDGMVLGMRLIDGLFIAEGWRTSSAARLPGETLDTLFQKNIFDIVDPLRSTTQLENSIGQVAGVPTPVMEITVKLVFSLAAFIVMIKLFFMLLGSYIGILVDAIFGPLILLTTAIPGSNNASNWLRSLLSNALVFPATFAMLYFAILFVDPNRLASTRNLGHFWLIDIGKTNREIISQTGWAPPLLGSGWERISSLIAFGIYLATPGVAEKIKEALAVKPSAFGAGAIQEIKGAAGRIPIISSFVRG